MLHADACRPAALRLIRLTRLNSCYNADMYSCAWPEGCEGTWYDMVTFLDEEGPGRCDLPLCRRHYDLMVTTIMAIRAEETTGIE